MSKRKIGLGKLAMKHARSISFAPSNPGPAYGLWMAGNVLTSARYHVKAARRLPEGERWGRDRKLAAALAELAEAEATYARTYARTYDRGGGAQRNSPIDRARGD